MSTTTAPSLPHSRLLTDVADIVSGFGFPKELQGKSKGDLPFFKVGDISIAWNSGQKNLTKAQHYLNSAEATAIRAKDFPKGTVVFAKIGEAIRLNRRAILGQSSIVDNNVMGLIPKDGVVDSRYLFYWSLMLRLGDISQATTVPSVRKSDVEQLLFPWLPLDQQKLIVAEIEKQFSRLDESVANLKRVKVNIKRYKAAVLKAAVEGRLVETEAELARRESRNYETGEQLLKRILETRRREWKGKGKYKEPAAPDTTHLPELPEGWVWATVEQLTWLVTSGSRGWGDFYSDTGFLFIRAQDIKTDELNLTSVARVTIPADAEGTRSSVDANDVLVTITGANVTKSALVPALSEKAFVSQHVALLKFNAPSVAPYILAWIVSPFSGRRILEALAYGAGKPGLSLEQLRALTLPLPPLIEQQRIIAEVDRRFTLVRELEAQLDVNQKRAERLRQSILGKAFYGELLVAQPMEKPIQSFAFLS